MRPITAHSPNGCKQIERPFTDLYEAIRYLLERDKQLVGQTDRKRIGFK